MAENKAGTSNRGPMGSWPDGWRKKNDARWREGKELQWFFKKLIRYIGNYKFAILAVMILRQYLQYFQ